MPPGRAIALFALGAILACNLWLILLFRDPSKFDRRKLLFLGVVCMLGVHGVAYYVGVYSVSVLALAIGTYFFGLSDHTPTGWAVYGTAAGGFFILQVLSVVGVLETGESLFSLKQSDPIALGAAAFVTQLMLAMTFWLARQSRQATLSAYERLEKASRQIRNRDALLLEVRDDQLGSPARSRIRRRTSATSAGSARSGCPLANGGSGSYSSASWRARAVSSPASSATRVSPKSRPALTPPAVMRFRSTTTRRFT